MEIYVKKRKSVAGTVSFSLVQRTGRNTPEESTKVLENETVASVNNLLSSKTIDIPKATAIVKKEQERMMEALRPRPLPLDSVNHDILERFWEKRYAHSK